MFLLFNISIKIKYHIRHIFKYGEKNCLIRRKNKLWIKSLVLKIVSKYLKRWNFNNKKIFEKFFSGWHVMCEI